MAGCNMNMNEILKVGEGKRQIVKKKDPHGKYEWILCLAQIVG